MRCDVFCRRNAGHGFGLCEMFVEMVWRVACEYVYFEVCWAQCVDSLHIPNVLWKKAQVYVTIWLTNNNHNNNAS